jgi:hypothetical protein
VGSFKLKTRSYRASDFEDDGAEERFIIPGRIQAGIVSSLYAHKGQGKNLVLTRMAADVSNGLWLGNPTERVRTLFQSKEDAPRLTVRRLKAAGADLTMIDVTDFGWTFPADLPRLRALLEQATAEGEPYGMVILDSIGAHHASMDNDTEVNQSMQGLTRLAQEFSVAIVWIGHLLDKASGGAAQMMQGSVETQKLSKATFVLGKNPDDAETLVLTTHRANFAKPVNLVLKCQERKIDGLASVQVAMEILGTDDRFTDDDVIRATVKPRKAGDGPDRVTTTAWYILMTLLEAGGSMAQNRLVEKAVQDEAFPTPTTWRKALRVAEVVKERGEGGDFRMIHPRLTEIQQVQGDEVYEHPWIPQTRTLNL